MRKGVSPIIAAVVLILLTITLGFFVYNSSAKYATQLAPAPTCENVYFKASLQHLKDKYSLEVSNLGNEEIEGFNLEIKDKFDNVDISTIDLIIKPGESISKDLELAKVVDKQLSLTPIIKSEEKNLPCDYVFARQLNHQITGFVIN
jgi:flagellin-like protein